MLERTRIDPSSQGGTVGVDVTIDEPKAYTAPFTVRLNQKIVPNGELIEFICAENERSTAHMIGK